MDNVLNPFAIALGACLGSVLRHIGGKGRITHIMTLGPLAQLMLTAIGAFIAGVLAAHIGFPGDAPSDAPFLATRNAASLFIVGILGGFVTFPGMASTAAGTLSAQERPLVLARTVTSLVISVCFFLAGVSFTHVVST